MICPYCKKQINDNFQFCPECGQEVKRKTNLSAVNTFWMTVDKENVERYRESKMIIDGAIRDTKKQWDKIIVTVIVLVLAIFIIGRTIYTDYQEQLINQVKHNLVGKSFTVMDTHYESWDAHIYEYWDLTFEDDSNVYFAHTETRGPRESDPNLEGPYTYTISRSISGDYFVHVQLYTFKLSVNSDNIPTDIAR